jgi:hypothetical protein
VTTNCPFISDMQGPQTQHVSREARHGMTSRGIGRQTEHQTFYFLFLQTEDKS